MDRAHIDKKRYKTIVGMVLLTLLVSVSGAAAQEQDRAGGSEETMLMFVGESRPVVTVASRYPESPTTAPAMVTVIGREEIERNGYQTLAELLAMQPGFFMASGGRGTVPYLRGLRDSVLFLYDGVPITTDVTKSFAPLDQEISLAAVDRVEIVRGPGSVLWGPDAFAGVVNIVPRRGRTSPGAEARLIAGSDSLQGASLNWARSDRQWDAFLSLNGVQERYHTPEYTVLGGTDTLDLSGYAELVGTLNHGDWLSLSGRWSDFNRRYTMSNVAGDLSWAGAKEAPFNYVKVKASKTFGASHYTLGGFFQETDYRVIDADFERQQRNRVLHLEMLWDRRIFKRGLLTAGASWRRNAVDGAVVREGFLPDFLAPEETFFSPSVDQENFSNELASLFSQFRYRWGKSEWWTGARLDDHSQYRSTLSYSLGFHRPLGETLRFKAAYGTAFRSPYSSQLFDNQQFDPESVRTASAQLVWSPAAGRQLDLTLFHSCLKDHLSEDSYGGLSLSSEREYYGAELSGSAQLNRHLGLNFGLSWLGDTGGEERFRSLRFSFVRPDGTQVSVFDSWDEPLDQGPGWLANLTLKWKIGPRHNLLLGARAGGDYDFSYEKGTVEGSYRHPLLIDLTYRRPGFFQDRDTFILRVTNLLDKDYSLPDIYGPADGLPLQGSLLWQYGF